MTEARRRLVTVLAGTLILPIWGVFCLSAASMDAAEHKEARAGVGVTPWIEQAYREMNQGNFDHSVKLFKQALEKDPGNKRARFGLGTVLIQLKRFREAYAILQKLVAEFPEDYSLKNNLAWLLATATDDSVRNGSKAVRVAQSALLQAPSDYHVWSTLSEAYYVSGEYEKALRAARIALMMSREMRGKPSEIREYREQVMKCSKAVEALSLIE